MIKPIARLVYRGSEKDDGIIIGVLFKGHNFFKPNTVYELREVMGEVVIKEVGKSWLGAKGRRNEWGRTFGDIVEIHGHKAFLSKKEYDHQLKQEDSK
jgi:hypothetical protein